MGIRALELIHFLSPACRMDAEHDNAGADFFKQAGEALIVSLDNLIQQTEALGPHQQLNEQPLQSFRQPRIDYFEGRCLRSSSTKNLHAQTKTPEIENPGCL